uniref:Secreted protein n=1 Tax=Phlebotomus kandelakii TaxID=1109342 RepID=A0A6B2EIE2_9DIPT
MREKLREIVFVLVMVAEFICGQDFPDTLVQHRTNRRRHHRHRGVLELGRAVALVGEEQRSIPLFEATNIDNEIIMEPINLPHSSDKEYTHFATSDVSDSAEGSGRTLKSRRSRKRHHHHRAEHRRQRKRKKARLKELDELRKKVAREERKWWRKRKKELQFEEMFFDQESHNPNVVPMDTTPCTKSSVKESDKLANLTSRIDHFRYHRVNSSTRIAHRGEGHALPFVAITDPRPRDGVTHKGSQPKAES